MPEGAATTMDSNPTTPGLIRSVLFCFTTQTHTLFALISYHNIIANRSILTIFMSDIFL